MPGALWVEINANMVSISYCSAHSTRTCESFSYYDEVMSKAAKGFPLAAFDMEFRVQDYIADNSM